MDYPYLLWRGKSSSESEFRRKKGPLCFGEENRAADPNFGEKKGSRFRTVDSDMQGLMITMHVIFLFLSCVFTHLARCHLPLQSRNLKVRWKRFWKVPVWVLHQFSTSVFHAWHSIKLDMCDSSWDEYSLGCNFLEFLENVIFTCRRASLLVYRLATFAFSV